MSERKEKAITHTVEFFSNPQTDAYRFSLGVSTNDTKSGIAGLSCRDQKIYLAQAYPDKFSDILLDTTKAFLYLDRRTGEYHLKPIPNSHRRRDSNQVKDGKFFKIDSDVNPDLNIGDNTRLQPFALVESNAAGEVRIFPRVTDVLEGARLTKHPSSLLIIDGSEVTSFGPVQLHETGRKSLAQKETININEIGPKDEQARFLFQTLANRAVVRLCRMGRAVSPTQNLLPEVQKVDIGGSIGWKVVLPLNQDGLDKMALGSEKVHVLGEPVDFGTTIEFTRATGYDHHGQVQLRAAIGTRNSAVQFATFGLAAFALSKEDQNPKIPPHEISNERHRKMATLTLVATPENIY